MVPCANGGAPPCVSKKYTFFFFCQKKRFALTESFNFRIITLLRHVQISCKTAIFFIAILLMLTLFKWIPSTIVLLIVQWSQSLQFVKSCSFYKNNFRCHRLILSSLEVFRSWIQMSRQVWDRFPDLGFSSATLSALGCRRSLWVHLPQQGCFHHSEQ